MEELIKNLTDEAKKMILNDHALSVKSKDTAK